MKIKNLKVGKRLVSLAAAGVMMLTGTAQAVNNKSNYKYIGGKYSTSYNDKYKFDYNDLTYNVDTNVYTVKQDDGSFITTISSTDPSIVDSYTTTVVDDISNLEDPSYEFIQNAETVTFDYSFLGGNTFSYDYMNANGLEDLYFGRELLVNTINPIIYNVSPTQHSIDFRIHLYMTDSQYSEYLDLSGQDRTRAGINNSESTYNETYREVATEYNHEYDTGIVTTNANLAYQIVSTLIQGVDINYRSYRIDCSKDESGEYIYKIIILYNLENETFKTEEMNYIDYEIALTYSAPCDQYRLTITLPETCYVTQIRHTSPISYCTNTESGIQKLIRRDYTSDVAQKDYTKMLQKKLVSSETILEYDLNGFIQDNTYVAETTEPKTKTIKIVYNGKVYELPSLEDEWNTKVQPQYGPVKIVVPELDVNGIVQSTVSPNTNTLYVEEDELEAIRKLLDENNPFELEVSESKVDNSQVSERVYTLPNLTGNGLEYYGSTGQDAISSAFNSGDNSKYNGLTTISLDSIPFYTYTPVDGDQVLTYFEGMKFSSYQEAYKFLAINAPLINNQDTLGVYLGSPFVSFNIASEYYEYYITDDFKYEDRTFRLIGNEKYKDSTVKVPVTNTRIKAYYSAGDASLIKAYLQGKYGKDLLANYEYGKFVDGEIVKSDTPVVIENGYTVAVDEVVQPTIEGAFVRQVGDTSTYQDEITQVSVRDDGMGTFYYRFESYYDSSAIDQKQVGLTEDGIPIYDTVDNNGRQYDSSGFGSVEGTKDDYDYSYGEGIYFKEVDPLEKIYYFPSSEDALEEFVSTYQGFDFDGTKTKVTGEDILLGTFNAVLGEGMFKDSTYEEAVEIMRPRLEAWAKNHLINQDAKVVFEQDGNEIYARIYVTNIKGYQVTGTFSTNKDVTLYYVTTENVKYDCIDYTFRKFDYTSIDKGVSKIVVSAGSNEKVTGYDFYPTMTVVVPKDMDYAIQNLEIADVYNSRIAIETTPTQKLYSVVFMPTKGFELPIQKTK